MKKETEEMLQKLEKIVGGKIIHVSHQRDFEDDFEDDFEPCSECDGHPACEDFGCAIKLGLGNMVKR